MRRSRTQKELARTRAKRTSPPSEAELATRIKPGEVLNPTGRNQYTAERELFQREIGDVLASELRELSKASETDLRAVRRAIVEAILEKAALGEPWACQLVADRLWPRGADSAAEAASESFADLVRLTREHPGTQRPRGERVDSPR